MNSYSCLVTVWPVISPRFLDGLSGRLLKSMLSFDINAEGDVSFYCEDVVEHAAVFDAGFASLLKQTADEHPLKKPLIELVSGLDGEDDFEFDEICLEEVLQGVIFESESAIRWFEVEAALVAGVIEPGQIGGWCSFVTAEAIKHVGTGGWLAEQRKAFE